MRSTGVLAGLALALGAGQAKAEDWRAVTSSHHDVVFVDADSVRRTADGRIAFRARHLLDRNDSNRDFGYDRIDVEVAGRCERTPDGQPVTAVGRRTYRLGGRPIPVVEWREEGLNEDLGGIAANICDGLIGHRRFTDLDSAMAEYRKHDSIERLAAHISGETELTGIVVQGFEMNAVSLCGPDECREKPPEETCWFDGNVSVPAPAGAPEWVNGGPRRDRAGAAFRGRIHRSREGKGFGHLGGFACLVETTGPSRIIDIADRREAGRDGNAAPVRPEVTAAHQAFAESIKSAAQVGLATVRRRWEVDKFSPGTGRLDACFSLPRFKGAELDFRAPALTWRGVERIGREGAQVVLASRDYGIDFYLPDPKTAPVMEAFLRKLSTRTVEAIEQKGAKVAIRSSDGGNESFRFGDPASAVLAAGMAERLRGREIAELKPWGKQIIATPLRQISLTFPDEALARTSEERMRALRAACAK